MKAEHRKGLVKMQRMRRRFFIRFDRRTLAHRIERRRNNALTGVLDLINIILKGRKIWRRKNRLNQNEERNKEEKIT